MIKIKNDYVLVTGATIFHAIALFFYGLIIREYVGPYEYGLYTISNLLLVYLGYLQLGVLNSYNRDYPQYIGAKNCEDAKLARNSVSTFLLIIYSIIGIILCVAALFLISSMRIEQKLGISIILSSCLALINNLYLFSTGTIRSEGKFEFSALLITIQTVIQVGIGIYFTKTIGYYGIFIALIVSTCIVTIMNRNVFKRVKIEINIKYISYSIKTGLPLLINGLIWTLVMSTDQLIIIKFFSETELGIYSLALMGFSTLVLIPTAISQVLYVKMSNVYGKTQDASLLLNQASKYTYIISFLSSFISVGAFYLLPIFIKKFMPAYSDGIIATQIIIVGVSFYSTSILYGNVFSVLKMNAKLLKTTLILCVVNIFMAIIFIYTFGKNINSLAYASSTSYCLYSILLIRNLSKSFKLNFFIMLRKTWAPVFLSILPCVLFYKYFSNIYISISISLVYLVFPSIYLFKRIIISRKV